MNTAVPRGFTLIELLVVIAIIAILAGLTAVTLPRALEKAKLTDVANDFNQIRTAMVEYYTKYDSYPPTYGFLAMPPQANAPTNVKHFLIPYTDQIKIHGNIELYDRFSSDENTNPAVDVNDPAQIMPLEYVRRTQKDAAGELRYSEDGLYGVDFGPREPTPGERPYVYIPANANQARKFAEFNRDNNRPMGDLWNAGYDQAFRFPPPKYDTYVLISVGPNSPTGTVNMLSGIPGTENRADAYHIAALRAYYLATRDWNANDVYDFDWAARTQEGEGKDPVNAFEGSPVPFAPGPLIYYGGVAGTREVRRNP